MNELEAIKNPAAQALGRLGGLKKSERKAQAARINSAKGVAAIKAKALENKGSYAVTT